MKKMKILICRILKAVHYRVYKCTAILHTPMGRTHGESSMSKLDNDAKRVANIYMELPRSGGVWYREGMRALLCLICCAAQMPPCEGLFSGKSFSLSLHFNAQDLLTATGIVQSNGGTYEWCGGVWVFMCMCACVCGCLCACVLVCMYMWCAFVRVCLCVGVYVHMCLCVWVLMCICACVWDVYVFMCLCVHMSV